MLRSRARVPRIDSSSRFLEFEISHWKKKKKPQNKSTAHTTPRRPPGSLAPPRAPPPALLRPSAPLKLQVSDLPLFASFPLSRPAPSGAREAPAGAGGPHVPSAARAAPPLTPALAAPSPEYSPGPGGRALALQAGLGAWEPSCLLDRGRELAIPRGKGTPNAFVCSCQTKRTLCVDPFIYNAKALRINIKKSLSAEQICIHLIHYVFGYRLNQTQNSLQIRRFRTGSIKYRNFKRYSGDGKHLNRFVVMVGWLQKHKVFCTVPN